MKLTYCLALIIAKNLTMALATDIQANEKMGKDVHPNVMMRKEEVKRNKRSCKDKTRKRE